jgi:MFS transporter, DHA1 family, multidrug resistance protein
MRAILQNKTLVKLFVVYSLVSISANFQHPVTPDFLNKIGLEISLYGFLFAFMALGLSLAAPISGRLTDRMGTRWLLFSGLISYGVFQTVFALNTEIVGLTLARLGAGLSVAFVFPILISYVVKVTAPEERSVALAVIAGSQLLFVSVGYFVGGQLSLFFEPQTIFFLQTATLWTVAVISLILDNVKVILAKAPKLSLQIPLRGFYMIAMYFLVSAVVNTVIRYFDVYFIDQGYDASQLGQFVLITGVLSVATNFLMLPQLVKRFKDYRLLQASILIISITLVLTFQVITPFIVAIFTTHLLFMMTRSIYDPLHNSYISKLSSYQGQMIGMSESAKMMGMFIGPIVGGYLYAYSQTLLFLIAAIVGFAAFIISLFMNASPTANPTI